MKLLGLISLILVIAAVILFLLLVKKGLFAGVKITKETIGPYLLVYKKHIGDYKNTGPVMDELYYDLKNNFNIQTTKGFGLYYDNPKQVDKEKLRSIAGCIIEGQSPQPGGLGEKYGVRTYPKTPSVVARFPYKGKISIILGVFKVYPKLNAYISGHKHPETPIMEIYDKPNEIIQYISSIDLEKTVFDDFLNQAR